MRKLHDVIKDGKLYYIIEIEYDLETSEAKVLKKTKLTDSKARAIHKAKELAVTKLFK